MPWRIAFLRPRLGVGGGERLALDAAAQYQARGCEVCFFVPETPTGPQFASIANGQIAVRSAASRWPEQLLGRLRLPLTIVRTRSAARMLASGADSISAIFCDVVPHVIPLVKRLTGRPVLYYCHFPDMMLARPGPERSAGFNLYRQPLDALEVRGIAAADAVVANSRFTASMLLQCVPALRAEQVHVVHPGVSVPARMRDDSTDSRTSEVLLLSISRFDPRKNLKLAIEAIAALKRQVPGDLFARIRLVLAGHLDRTLPEACRVVDDLQRLAETRGVSDCVGFVFSPTDGELEALLNASRCVLYTPEAEHFGYVPLEAMAAGRPVVAVNRGGPVETVVHDVTGLLCDPAPDAFADALAGIVAHPELATRLGRAARVHVARNFSLDSFGARLWSITRELIEPQGSRVNCSASAT